MGKKNKLIEKLIRAAGGWEKFLYQTLKEVCDDVSPTVVDSGVTSDILEEARIVVQMYENKILQEKISNEPPDENVVKPTPVIKTQARKAVSMVSTKVPGFSGRVEAAVPGRAGVPIDKPVEIKIEDVVLVPVPRSTPESKKLTGRVGVGKDAGASQGELPMPSGYRMVNRQSITITTDGGLELGRGSGKGGEEGQIKGQHVSGHISATGAFRLVFKDNTLGAGLVNYEVVSLPSKMTKKQFEEAVAVRNSISVEKLQGVLQELEKVFTPCSCGAADCFGWKAEDVAEIKKTVLLYNERVAARHGANTTGGVS